MKYAELKREFNIIVDTVGENPITDQARYDELVKKIRFLYAHNEYFVGVTIGYQVKENVVEPMFNVSLVVVIDGERYAMWAPSPEIERIKTVLFEQWKKGDADFFSLFADKTNLL